MTSHVSRRIKGAQLAGLGHYAPARVVSNEEIETSLALETGWIERRTGIRSRRYAAEGELMTDLAKAAGEQALQQAEANHGLERKDVGLTILATSTPDHLLPPSAPLLAHKLGLTGSGGIDMAGACSGFLYALAYADGFVRLHHKPVLVVAGNILSRRINPDERDSAILFGDAAGAFLLMPTDDQDKGVIGLELTSDGAHYDLIKIPAGGSAKPFSVDMCASDALMTITDGRAVFSQAVDIMTSTAQTALKACGLTIADVDHWIPHQANRRIFAKVQDNLDLSSDQLVATIDAYGNSSAGTIPFSLSHEANVRSVGREDILLMSAVGAGLAGGSVVMRV